MLHALLILDISKFLVFEYYTDKMIANDIVAYIETLNQLEGDYSHESMNFHISSISERFFIALVYSEEELTALIIDNLKEIGLNVMKGDKLTLRQVLESKSIQNFQFVY